MIARRLAAAVVGLALLGGSAAWGLEETWTTSKNGGANYIRNFKIQETAGPTNLLIGAIPDGSFLQRSGTGIIGTPIVTSLTSTQIGYGSGTNTLTSEAALSYNATNNTVTIATADAAGNVGLRLTGPTNASIPGQEWYINGSLAALAYTQRLTSTGTPYWMNWGVIGTEPAGATDQGPAVTLLGESTDGNPAFTAYVASQDVAVGPLHGHTATTSTKGFFHFAGMNGTPTGTPKYGDGGRATMTYDTTGRRLWTWTEGDTWWPVGQADIGPGYVTSASTGIHTIVTSIPATDVGPIATDRLLGRDTAGSGAVEQLTASGGLEWTGTGGIQTSAFTGDVTKTAGGTALTIANDAVTDAKLRNSGALSFIGRSVNTTGDPADISASAGSDCVFREGGSTIACGTVATAGYANNSVTVAKFQQLAGLSVVGNSTNATANVAAITGTDGQVLRVSGTTLGFGAVLGSSVGLTATQIAYGSAGGTITSEAAFAYTAATNTLTVDGTVLSKVPVANVKAFGATGDGVTDDTTAVQAAFTASTNVYFPAGTYVISTVTVATDGTRVFGDGVASVLSMLTGATGVLLDVGNTKRVTVDNLALFGGLTSTQKAVTSSPATRIGIALNANRDSKLSSLTIHGFGASGITFYSGTADRLAHVEVVDVTLFNNWIAIDVGLSSAEYMRFANLDISGNYKGINVLSGNLTVANSKINDNGVGVFVYGTGNANNGHGNVNGSLINHNTEAIHAEDVTIGFNFIANNIFEGAVNLINSTGINIEAGILDATSYCFDGGGINYVRFNYVPNGYGNTVTHNCNGHADSTLMIDNYLSGGTFVDSNRGYYATASPATGGIVYGAGTNIVSTTSTFKYDSATGWVGIGTASPNLAGYTSGSRGVSLVSPGGGGGADLAVFEMKTTAATSSDIGALDWWNGSKRVGQFEVAGEGSSTSGRFVFWTAPTASGLASRMSIGSTGVTVDSLAGTGTRMVTATSAGLLGVSAATGMLRGDSGVVTAASLPASGAVLLSAGSTATPTSANFFRHDSSPGHDIVEMGDDITQCWYNLGGNGSYTNYERVCERFTAGQWFLQGESLGTGNDPNMRIDAGAAGLTLQAGTAVAVTAGTGGLAIGSPNLSIASESGGTGANLTITGNASNGEIFATDWAGFTFLTIQNHSLVADANRVTITGSPLYASATSLVADAIKMSVGIEVSGTTTVTTATGLNAVTVARPSIAKSDAGALTIDHAASFYVANAPLAGTDVTITNPYAVWIDSGKLRYDGAVNPGGGATATLGTIGGSGPGTAAQAKWLPVVSDGTTYFIPLWQ